MSDTLQYLRSTADSAGNAAQSFLNKKLAQNKYSATPDIDYSKAVSDGDREAHNAGMNDPYAMGEGYVPSGAAYDDQRVVTNQAEIDAWNKANPSTGKAGQLSAEQIRDKFGFEFNEEHASQAPTNKKKDTNEETGAIYNRKTGEYIGTIKGYSRNDEGYKTKDGDGYLRLDDGIEGFENPMTDYAKEHGLYDDEIASFNSIGDVTKLANMIHGQEQKKGPEKKYGMKPIEHSPEIRQAKSRVKEYEERAWSGEMSNGIFDGASAAAPAEDYRFEATEGLDGIGTEGGAAKADKSATSTASFLDKKKQDVKSDYNFKPAS